MIKSAKSCHTAGYDRIDDAVKRQQSAYIFDTEIKMKKKYLKDPWKKQLNLFDLIKQNTKNMTSRNNYTKVTVFSTSNNYTSLGNLVSQKYLSEKPHHCLKNYPNNVSLTWKVVVVNFSFCTYFQWRTFEFPACCILHEFNISLFARILWWLFHQNCTKQTPKVMIYL